MAKRGDKLTSLSGRFVMCECYHQITVSYSLTYPEKHCNYSSTIVYVSISLPVSFAKRGTVIECATRKHTPARASQRYRGSHGFEFRNLKFFSGLSLKLL